MANNAASHSDVESPLDFGSCLRSWRLQVDLSQRELARRADLNFSYLSKIEAGLVPPPSEEKIRALVTALDRSKEDADYLVFLAQENRIPTDVIKAALIRNPGMGALLRRIQNRRLTDDELGALMSVIDANRSGHE